MADPRFFDRVGPFTAAALAAIGKAEVPPGANAGLNISDVGRLEDAGPEQISFFENIKYRDQLHKTNAGACLVAPEYVGEVPANTVPLITRTPYKAYALIAQAFYPQPRPASNIHPTAHIDPSAKVGSNVTLEMGAHIGPNAEIGDDCWVGPYAVIGRGVVLGPACVIGAHATISHALVGAHVRIYPGARIGQDGFGFAIDPTGHVKVPQLGRVIIEDGVEIGANTAIDRGALGDTHIGAGSWIDNLVQIGHNVKIGRGCVLVAQVGVAGSTVLGDFVVLAGQAGIAGHLNIGSGVRVAAQSGVMRDIPPKSDVMGSPAVPIKQHMRHVAMLNRLIKRDKSA